MKVIKTTDFSVSKKQREEHAEYVKYIVGLETEFGRRVLTHEDYDYAALFNQFNKDYKKNAHRFNERSMYVKADVNHFENTYKPLEHARV